MVIGIAGLTCLQQKVCTELRKGDKLKKNVQELNFKGVLLMGVGLKNRGNHIAKSLFIIAGESG
jgi:hypothetical protein